MSNHYMIGDYTYCLQCKKQLNLFDYMPIKIMHSLIRLPSFCLQCQYELPYIHRVFCQKCSAYKDCYDGCDEYEELTQSFSCIAYDEEVKQWIRRFKFEGEIKVGEALTPLLAIAVDRYKIATRQGKYTSIQKVRQPLANRANETIFNIVTSVPISQQRLIERGFNQAAYFADAVAQKLKCPQLSLLTVSNSFEHSSHMNKLERMQTVQSKFYGNERALMKLKKIKSTVQNARLNIIIVDDIYTTGHTLRACARVIHDFLGTSCNIYGITLARA